MSLTTPGSAARSAAPGSRGSRWHGVDAARGLAVIGMMAAHTWPRGGDYAELLVDGRPSVLFAVVAGVALGLITGGSTPPRERRGAARGRVAIRAVILIIMGLLLWMLPSGIAIILDGYGIMFLLMLPLLFAPRWLLGTVALGLLVAAPFARDQFVAQTGAWPTGPGSLATDPLATLVDWLLTGYYPALLWLPLLLVGLLCARSGLERTRVRLLMLGLGAAASIAGYGAAVVLPDVDASAHSGSTAELLGAGGLALAIIAAALLLLDATPPRHVALVIAAPLTALGRVALTVYTAHVLIIAALSSFGPAGLFAASVGIPLLVGMVLGGIVFGVIMQAIGRQGPLEWMLSTLAGLPFRGRVHHDAEPAARG